MKFKKHSGISSENEFELMSPNEIFENLAAGYKLQIKGWHPNTFIHKPRDQTVWHNGSPFTAWDDLIDSEWVIRGASFLEVLAEAKPYEIIRRDSWENQTMHLDCEGSYRFDGLEFLAAEDINAFDWGIVKGL